MHPAGTEGGCPCKPCQGEETDPIKCCPPVALVTLSDKAACTQALAVLVLKALAGSDPANAPRAERPRSLLRLLELLQHKNLFDKWLQSGSARHCPPRKGNLRHSGETSELLNPMIHTDLGPVKRGQQHLKYGYQPSGKQSTWRVVKKTLKQEQRPEMIPAVCTTACATATWRAGLKDVGVRRGAGGEGSRDEKGDGM